MIMDVAITAKQGKISKALREQAEEGMGRIEQILGRNAHANITFGTQRHVHIVDIQLQARTQKFSATGKANTPVAALKEAIERAESQASRYRDRRLVSKRLPKEEKVLTAPPVARPKARAPQPGGEAEQKKATAKARASIAVHSFPVREAVVEPHILNSGEAIAIKPMTIEEAVKEAEFRDRDLLVFRTASGDLFVLHRRRDGQMELVEVP
jgi:putative sigma-54 modulation protein